MSWRLAHNSVTVLVYPLGLFTRPRNECGILISYFYRLDLTALCIGMVARGLRRLGA